MTWKHVVMIYSEIDAKDVMEDYTKDVMEPGHGYDEDFIRRTGGVFE